jgi:integrase
VAAHLTRRRGIWHYCRRTPARFAGVDARTFVLVSLQTRDRRRAAAAAVVVDRAVEARWRALADGAAEEAETQWRGFVALARLEGFEYRPARQLAAGPLEEIVARVERLTAAAAPALETALLGGADAPPILLSGLCEWHATQTRDRRAGMSEDQKRRWAHPRRRAVDNLIAVVGDKSALAISRADAIAFRNWWLDRTESEGLQNETANKDIGHLAVMFGRLLSLTASDAPNPFARLRLDGGARGKRPPFSAAWIRDRLLAPGALDGANAEMRDIILVLIETGARPHEICNLLAADIALGHDTPHLRIRPAIDRAAPRRLLKTGYSSRDLPLVGVALEAMTRRPEGFPRYLDRAAAFSAAANKFLRENGLLETDRHTVYSLRHSFKDRLTAADAPDLIDATLMGHKFDRPDYGAGPTLAHLRDWMLRIAVLR